MSETMAYTTEEEAIVIKILKTKNFYEILDVPNDASVNDIKAAHKKLVLKVHPDKNHFPRAKEAFHAVRKAAAVLLSVNRQEYDAYLRSPRGSSAYKFNLSDEAVEAILVTAGIAAVSPVIATGVVQFVDWLEPRPEQQENESESSEENSE